MAVEKPQSIPSGTPIRDYWPRYYNKAVLVTIAMQFACTTSVGAALVVSGAISVTPEFAVIMIAILATSLGINVLLVSQLLIPLQDLTSALTHVSGEPNTIAPPNPNARHFERDGFKPLLQLIYELSAKKPGSDTSQSLPVSHSNLTRALDGTSAGIIVLNQDRSIQYANKSAPVHTDSQGNRVIDLLFNDATLSLQQWLDQCEQHAVTAEYSWQRIPNKIVGEEGRKIYDITASYQKDSSAEVVLVLLERTGLYQPEDDGLDFIAFAAHELRGPITVIRGYLDVLSDELRPVLQDDQEELLKRLIVSSSRLSSYINNILNTSRYDRRHLKLHLGETTVAAIYATIRDDMELRAHSQSRLLSVAIPEDLPAIAADSTSISEVLGNLIDNAIKYSHEGGTIIVRAEGGTEFIKISVEDQGIGMPGNVVRNLFHKFYRSHRSRETVAGTGIGLYICKAIVESHGGKMSVRSQENEGSTFEFTLPVYSTVAEKLKTDNNSNESLIKHREGWIKNHSLYRG